MLLRHTKVIAARMVLSKDVSQKIFDIMVKTVVR